MVTKNLFNIFNDDFPIVIQMWLKFCFVSQTDCKQVIAAFIRQMQFDKQ